MDKIKKYATSRPSPVVAASYAIVDHQLNLMLTTLNTGQVWNRASLAAARESHEQGSFLARKM